MSTLQLNVLSRKTSVGLSFQRVSGAALPGLALLGAALEIMVENLHASLQYLGGSPAAMSMQRAEPTMVCMALSATSLCSGLCAAEVLLVIPCLVRKFPSSCKINSPLIDRKSTRLNSSHSGESRMPSSA